MKEPSGTAAFSLSWISVRACILARFMTCPAVPPNVENRFLGEDPLAREIEFRSPWLPVMVESHEELNH
jgi:hypothetical protein